MINRDEITCVYGVSLERWCQRYGIEVFDVPCPACGAALRTTIPFFADEYRGLITPVCACGSADRPYAVVRAGDDLFEPGFVEAMARRRKDKRKRLQRLHSKTGGSR